jgi:hypothetical protein
VKPSALGALAVAASVVALVGCTGDPEPRIVDDPSRTETTSSPTPTDAAPSIPSLPADATLENEKGVRAFVDYFWDVVNYAQSVPDSTALNGLYTPFCDACDGAIGFLKELEDSEGEVTGGDYALRIQDVQRQYADQQSIYSVEFTVKNKKMIVDAPGRKNDRVFNPSSSEDRFVVNWIDGGWKVSIWEQQA